MPTSPRARKAAKSTKEAVGAATETTKDAAAKAASATTRAARTTRKSTAKGVQTAKVTKAARAGKVETARELAAEAELDEGMAAKVIAEAEALHYQAEVNKRGISVTALTKTLNERWENGWGLAHILEQRGNTVLIFEKRS